MKYVRDIPFKEFVDSHHRAFDDDLAELRRSNEDEDVPLIFTETEEILGLLIGLTHPRRILEIGTAYGYEMQLKYSISLYVISLKQMSQKSLISYS